MTYEQQLIEEVVLIGDLLNQFTPMQIQTVPKIREVFRYLNARKQKAEQALRNFKRSV